MESSTEITVRYAETDQMGIVHHSNYPIWFEVGRTEFFKSIGIPNSEIEKMGIILPLTDMECNFKYPAKYEDRIVVKTKVKRLTCAKIEFYYEILKKYDDRIIALGKTIHGWTDKALKPLNIEKKLPELSKLLKEYL